jgi:hypothetical protein
LIFLSLIGLFRCLLHRRYWTEEWVLAHGVIAITVITALVFFGSPRYRDGILPVLMVYAAVGIQTLLSRNMMSAAGGWTSRLETWILQ